MARGLIAVFAGCAALLQGLAALPAQAGEPTIAWRVERQFRLFEDPADTELFRATYASLSDDERKTPVLSAERALEAHHPEEGWAATIVGKTCWDGRSNRYACKSGESYINPTSHAVVAQLGDVPDAATVDCTWVTTPFGRRGRPERTTERCDQPVRLDVPYPSGAEVAVQVGTLTVATATVKVTDLLIVGVGDSFGSGEGNPDVPVRFSRERAADYGNPVKNEDLVGYPTRVGEWAQIGDKRFIDANARWHDQACHRSLYSQQLRAALQLAIEDDHRAVTYLGFACSGAEVTAGAFLAYKGNEWVPNPPDLSQISAASNAQCDKAQATAEDLPEAYHMGGRIPELKGGLVLLRCPPEKARKIDLLFVSLGGNDIGFARLVANAVLADQSLLKKLGGWFGQVYEAQKSGQLMETLGDRYKALNRAIHTVLHVPWEESDRVVLTAYPGLAILEDGKSVCPDGRAGMDVLSDFALSAVKANEGQGVAEKLNTKMRRSAKEQGWRFAESHRRAFLGRGICAGYSENAFSSADDLRLPRKRNGEWQPYNPADFRAYAPRQRWFRTPNDAFMTDNFHVSASLMQKALKLESLSWFQVLLAATYSGAFHPTAEGHAAIADAVVDEARHILEKYERRSQNERVR